MIARVRPDVHGVVQRDSALMLLNALPTPVLGVSPDSRLFFANPAALELMHGARRPILGCAIEDIFGRDSDVARLVLRVLTQSDLHAEAECQIEGPGFAVGLGLASVAWVEDQSAVLVSLTPKGRRRSDVTSHAPPPMARTLAHEVRNPLAGIRGAAQLIGKTSEGDMRALADLICEEVDRISRLTDRIDGLDAMAAPQFQSLNVHAALDRVAHLIRPAFPNVDLVTDYDPSLPPVLGDLDQLIQALLNLVKNAAEAAPRQGGRIRLSTRYRAGARLRGANGAQPRSLLEIAVADNGPGVPGHIMARLFEPFATTKPNGVGLGLAVAGHIVESHGGRIDVDSAPGATVFRVFLPMEPQA